MTENTKLLVLAGVHGRQSGQLGSDEEGFLRDSQGQIDLLQRKKGEDIKAKNIKFEVKDVGQINTLSDSDTKARAFDEKKFVEAVESFKPTVLILAFCWSRKFELNDLLRSAGIYSTLILRYVQFNKSELNQMIFILSHLLHSHSQGGSRSDH